MSNYGTVRFDFVARITYPSRIDRTSTRIHNAPRTLIIHYSKPCVSLARSTHVVVKRARTRTIYFVVELEETLIQISGKKKRKRNLYFYLK